MTAGRAMSVVSKIPRRALASAAPQSDARNPPSPRILFFTRILPEPGSTGAGAYAAEILDYLQRNGCEIRVVWTQPPDRLKYTFYNTLPYSAARTFDIRPRHCYRIGKHVFNPGAVWLPRKARLLYFLKRCLQRLHIFPRQRQNSGGSHGTPATENRINWDEPCSPAERAFLYEHAGTYRPDILIANYPWMLDGLEKERVASHCWVLTHDYRFRRCSVTADGRFREIHVAPEARAAEQRVLSAADILIAIQQNEAAAYIADHPGKKILTVCMPVRMPPEMPPAETSSHKLENRTHPIVAFIGSGHLANRQSALWFLRLVWPLVLRNISHARLRVAGRVCDVLAPLKRNERPRVELLGHVPDLAAFYAGATIAIVPILEGSGVKIKLLEAIAHDRPTVTTSVGLDGLEFFRPALSVADTPRNFAAAITRLLHDPEHRSRQVATARLLAHQHLTPETCCGPLLSAARSAVQSVNHDWRLLS